MMNLLPKGTLIKSDFEKSLRMIINDGFTSQIMVVLTTGPFLIAFGLLLGANYLIIGILAAIPPLIQIMQIPSIHLVEKIRNRKRMTIMFLILYRICILSIALIPFMVSLEIGLFLLIIFLILQSIFASIGHTAWASWMHDLIPHNQLGSFYSKRMMISYLVAIGAGLLAAFYIDYGAFMDLRIQIYKYSILFFIAFIFGLVSVFFISQVTEPKMSGTNPTLNFFTILNEPFKDKNYRNLIIFLGVWSFGINLVAPFFTVYMLEKLQLNISLILIFSTFSQIANVLFLRVWGKLSDKFSNRSVLNLCCPILLLCIFGWTFTTLSAFSFITILLLMIIHIFMGISMAGITLATQNISLKLAPKGKGNPYLAVTTVITSLALGIAPIIGGLFANYFEASQFSWTFQLRTPNGNFASEIFHLQGFDFYFIFAFFVGLYSIFRLTKVKERGDVKRKIIFHELLFEMKKTMRNLSTVGGIERIVLSPKSIIVFPIKHKTKKKQKYDSDFIIKSYPDL